MADLAFMSAQADFAVGLLRETALNSNASLILSPISIALALSLAYAGAGGDTRKEFESVFAKGGTSGDALHSLFRQTLSQLNAADKNVTLELANRAYAAQKLDVKAAYKELIATNYGGDFKQVDFGQAAGAVKEINDFVANVTHDKIRDLLSSDSVDATTKLVLVNAVYFKGTWKNQFNEERTTDEKFFVSENSETQVKMMKMKTKVNYAETADVQVLELPYADEGAKFIAFLPKENGIANNESLMISEAIHKAFIESNEAGSEAAAATAVLLTRMIEESEYFSADHPFLFGITFHNQWLFLGSNEQGSEAAAATGVEIVLTSFNPDAEKPLAFVADHPFLFVVAFHDKPLFSNEKGSEAAAATAVVMNRSRPAAPVIPPTFRADHPFLFVIAFHDKPLFVGRFVGGKLRAECSDCAWSQ
ncbi:SERPIN domain-containing protein [Aphelenchoides fujianensis]|nr:SERPIN domain-containing protein [Aphelenchoides fujianensis]